MGSASSQLQASQSAPSKDNERAEASHPPKAVRQSLEPVLFSADQRPGQLMTPDSMSRLDKDADLDSKAARKAARAELRARKAARHSMTKSQIMPEVNKLSHRKGSEKEAAAPTTPRVRSESESDDDAPATQLRSEARSVPRAAARTSRDKNAHSQNMSRELQRNDQETPTQNTVIKSSAATPSKSAKKRHLMQAHDPEEESVKPAKRRKRSNTTASSSKTPKASRSSGGSQMSTWLGVERSDEVEPKRDRQRKRVSSGVSVIKAQEPVKHGPMDADEKQIIQDEVEADIEARSLTQHDFNDQVQTGASPIADLYTTLQRKLPHRMRDAIRKYCHRAYHNLTRGNFDAEADREIAEAYTQRPRQWAWIAAQVGRFPDDVRDRWRDYIQHGESRSTQEWTKQETDALYTAVRTALERMQAAGEAAENLTVRELPCDLIGWNAVSEQHGTRSRGQCREKWRMIVGKKKHDSRLRDTRRHEERAKQQANVIKESTEDELLARFAQIENIETQIREAQPHGWRVFPMSDKQRMIEEMHTIASESEYESRSVFWNAVADRYDGSNSNSSWGNTERQNVARVLKRAKLLSRVMDAGQLKTLLRLFENRPHGGVEQEEVEDETNADMTKDNDTGKDQNINGGDEIEDDAALQAKTSATAKTSKRTVAKGRAHRSALATPPTTSGTGEDTPPTEYTPTAPKAVEGVSETGSEYDDHDDEDDENEEDDDDESTTLG